VGDGTTSLVLLNVFEAIPNLSYLTGQKLE